VKTKICTKCKKRRPVEKFHWIIAKKTKEKPRLSSWCKDCTNTKRNSTRAYEHALKYGLSIEGMEELNVIFPACAVCGAKEPDSRLHVDHCHETGEVRGRLCLQCNTAIGQLKDDIKLMHKAVEYVVGDNPKRQKWASKLLRNPKLKAEKPHK
jgi:hypothetical protein